MPLVPNAVFKSFLIFLWETYKPIAKWFLSYVFFLSMHYKIREWEAKSCCPSGSAGINTNSYLLAAINAFP